MTRYVLYKASRTYAYGLGYSGPSCDRAGVPKGKIYDTEEEALQDIAKLTKVNPVGFRLAEYKERQIISEDTLTALRNGEILARPGDFIKSKLAGSCCGFVTKIVSKKSLGLCYVIRKSNNSEDIIPVKDAEFIAPFEWE